MAIQVKATATGKLRYRLVYEHSDHRDYWIEPATRWCASVEGANQAFRKPAKEK